MGYFEKTGVCRIAFESSTCWFVPSSSRMPLARYLASKLCGGTVEECALVSIIGGRNSKVFVLYSKNKTTHRKTVDSPAVSKITLISHFTPRRSIIYL